MDKLTIIEAINNHSYSWSDSLQKLHLIKLGGGEGQTYKLNRTFRDFFKFLLSLKRQILFSFFSDLKGCK